MGLDKYKEKMAKKISEALGLVQKKAEEKTSFIKLIESDEFLEFFKFRVSLLPSHVLEADQHVNIEYFLKHMPKKLGVSEDPTSVIKAAIRHLKKQPKDRNDNLSWDIAHFLRGEYCHYTKAMNMPNTVNPYSSNYCD